MSSSLLQYLIGQNGEQSSPLMALMQRVGQQAPPQSSAPPAMPPQLAPPQPSPMSAPRAQPQNAPGLLSRFSSGVLNALAPDPGEQVRGLIGPEAIRAAQKQSLLSLGAGLLSQSGYSQRPITLGEALGKSLQASQQQYGQSLNTAVDNATNAQNAASWAEQRRGTALENQAKAQALATAAAIRESIQTTRKGYSKYATGWDGLTPEQTIARYRQWMAEADQAGDTEVGGKLGATINVLQETLGKATPKDRYQKVDTAEGTYMIDSADPTNRVRVGTPIKVAQPSVSVHMDPQEKVGMQTAVADRKSLIAESMKFRDALSRAQPVLNMERLPDAQLGGPQSIAVLYQFIKAMDPNSVREGELKLAESGDPIVSRLVNLSQKLRVGNQISVPTMRAMIAAIKDGLSQQAASHAEGQKPRIENVKQFLPGMSIDSLPDRLGGGSGFTTFRRNK